jgi:ketosteroid isomerase-like protein
MRFDVVIADGQHLAGDSQRRDLEAACSSWGSDVVFFDVAAAADRHDSAKLARAFGTVLA